MSSRNYNEWWPTFTAQYTPMDSILASDSLQATEYSLPAIPEEDWDFGWGEDMFPDLGAYADLEQHSHVDPETVPSENVPSTVLEDLINVQTQVQKLRQDISELQAIFSERLDGLEKVVAVVQRYVNNLVPWSKEVHEKCSQLLEAAKRQEEGPVNIAEASAKSA